MNEEHRATDDIDGPQRVSRSESSPEVHGRARELRRQPTASEERLWQALRGRRFRGLKFRRQRSVGPFIPDFYCVDRDLAVEVDGGIHDDPEIHAHDAVRDERRDGRRVRVVRLPAALVMQDVTAALRAIGHALDHPPQTTPSASPADYDPASAEARGR
jgi:very-short-patch-repair endonuclease